jgi:glycosyltransferase involved in cell wall biosynthesis
MVQVVVHTRDVVGDRMAGPGIRALHLAEELGKHFETTLIAQAEDGGVWASGPPFHRPEARQRRAPHDVLKTADVLIGQPARGFRRRRQGQRIIYDLFAPSVLELRELYGNRPNLRQRIHLAAEWWRLAYALDSADLLVCGVAKQREFYEKLQTSDAPWIEVPFGIDLDDTRVCEKPRDNIAVWGGGLWEWLDPATAVDAIVQLNAEGLRAKLLFLGRARPNRELIDRRRDDRVDALIARGRGHVSAGQWVPYRERLSWLRAGKVAIMLHRRTAEAEYAIRTRLFDAIAAAVPVVATRGGFAADLVEAEGLGIVVPPEDVAAVAAAVRTLLTDDDFHAGCVQQLERLRPRFAWEVVTRPLVEAIMQWRI